MEFEALGLFIFMGNNYELGNYTALLNILIRN